ncbi:MAG: tetratricopeptide repeat protein, partial [Candidatus Omnitrophica bacterium]|nr:tetratricopeptide repeat protein [Candidatus Omnitrophota bacterium]
MTADALELVGFEHYALGHFAQADLYFKHALRLKDELLGWGHDESVQILNHLAYLCRDEGSLAEARNYLLQAERRLQLDRQAMDPALADQYEIMGDFADETADPEGAVAAYRNAFKIRSYCEGPRTLASASLMSRLAQACQNAGWYEQAENIYLTLLKILDGIDPEDHELRGMTMNNLAMNYMRWGRAGQARPMFQKSLQCLVKRFGPDHPGARLVMSNIRESFAGGV